MSGQKSGALSRVELKNIILAQHFRKRQPLALCSQFNGIQAQFPSYPEQAIRIRSAREDFLDKGWREQVVRAWTIRRTLHVFPESDLPLYLYERPYKLLRDIDALVEDAYLSLPRKQYFAQLILSLLEEKDCTRKELKSACQKAGLTQEEMTSVFNPWGGLIRHLTDSGQLVQRFGVGAPYKRVYNFVPLDRQTAELEIARRYFAHCGPLRLKDAQYYFKCPARNIREWMSALNLESIYVDGERYYYLKDSPPDFSQDVEAAEACVFLAGFDPLLLVYEKQSSLFLKAEQIRAIFTLTGIVRPSILYQGELVGSWKKEKGLVCCDFFSGTGPDIQARVTAIAREQQALH